MLSMGVGLVALLVAVTAAYAFSRFKFKMRQVLMVMVFIPLLMPAVGLATPLYLLMNQFRLMDCGEGITALYPLMSCAAGVTGKMVFNLRDSLLGVGIAMIAGALPFAVWNLKGYLDTIPLELEEAASIDGAESEPDLLPDRPAAGHPAAGSHILPRLHRALAGICHLLALPQQT